MDIYEKGIKPNKIKYEREIKLNEKKIQNLENEKIRLIEQYRNLIGYNKFNSMIENFKKKNLQNSEKEESEKIIEKESRELKDNLLILNDNKIENKDNNNNEDTKNNQNSQNQNDNMDNDNGVKRKNFNFMNMFDDNVDVNKSNQVKNDIEKKEEINTNNNLERKNENENENKINKFDYILQNNNQDIDKERKEETPPNEYSDLEEFQI